MKFNIGDTVVAEPEDAEEWNTFIGTIANRHGIEPEIFTVEDQDGECFDCYAFQLSPA